MNPQARGPAGLHPGYFAMVMATGIISIAARPLPPSWLSPLLLGVGALAYAILCVLLGWRLVAFLPRVLADARAPDRAFAFFTFVAASDLLGLRLALDGWTLVPEALVVLAAAAWLLLSYGVPAALITSPRKVPLETAANGTWLIWVVGTQSLAGGALTIGAIHPPWEAAMVFLAAGLWSVASVLYLLLMAILTQRLLIGELSPAQLTPPYWIAMGATAITVFAAGRILSLGAPLPIPAATLAGLAFMLWAFGTWWIPLLIVLGVWRHLIRRVPLVYEPTLWSMVFPLGMYAAASQAFGEAAHLGALRVVGDIEVWVAVAAWAATLGGTLVALARPLHGSARGRGT